MNKILLTGATGFIGRHLFQELKKNKNNLIYPISLNGGQINNETISQVDLNNFKLLEKIFIKEKFDLIYHLAAYISKKDEEDAIKMLHLNGQMTLNLLKLANKYGVKKFIYASSMSVYHRQLLTPIKEQYVLPINFYGLSKLVGEISCELFRKAKKIKTICLRYASVYGPGQKPDSVLPYFISKVINGENLEIFGKGVRTQDFVYVKDVVKITAKCGFNKAEGVYNIGSGKEVSMKKLAQSIIKIFNPKVKLISRDKESDQTKFCLAINKAKKVLHYYPKYNLIKGLKEIKRYAYKI